MRVSSTQGIDMNAIAKEGGQLSGAETQFNKASAKTKHGTKQQK